MKSKQISRWESDGGLIQKLPLNLKQGHRGTSETETWAIEGSLVGLFIGLMVGIGVSLMIKMGDQSALTDEVTRTIPLFILAIPPLIGAISEPTEAESVNGNGADLTMSVAIWASTLDPAARQSPSRLGTLASDLPSH